MHIRQASRLLCCKLCIIYRRQCKNLFVFKYLRMVSWDVLRPSSCPLNIQYRAINNLQWMIGSGCWGGGGEGVSHPRKKPTSRGAGPQLTEAHICRGILCHMGTSSYMVKYLCISSYIRKPFLIYDPCTRSHLNFPICILVKFSFLFYQWIVCPALTLNNFLISPKNSSIVCTVYDQHPMYVVQSRQVF